MQAKSGAPSTTVKGTVERAFYFQGRALAKGETVELPRIFALEMQSARKFTIAAEPAPADAAPATDEPADAPKGKGKGKGAKETSDVG